MSIFSKLRHAEGVAHVKTYSETKTLPSGVSGVLTYEVYKGHTAQEAREFLATKTVDQPLYYIVVETPEGNWGKDIQGLYKEP